MFAWRLKQLGFVKDIQNINFGKTSLFSLTRTRNNAFKRKDMSQSYNEVAGFTSRQIHSNCSAQKYVLLFFFYKLAFI